ncbi:hypothetical protein TWF192_009839 [Orbilia oligospora]|uniref:Uncharacterized protein n=1 Tax=Orbilia oligospora TaxID=2813651 RepID=A0A6G1MKI7_ORBOL|nr:hypothetical protein TWF679_005417 [Orbilia oligospora]KAF3260558.1 hypothetical protein TWF192_009839 [Orbilia oligospora]
MPVKRTTARARSAPGQLHRAPYRRSPPPPSPRRQLVTTITVTAPTPTSGGGPEGNVLQVTAGMPFDIRMFLRTRRVAAGGAHSSSPFLLGEPRETASPRPRSPLQRRRHGSEPPLEGLPVPLKKVSRCGVKKTAKGSSRQKGPRPNATSSQRKSTNKPGDKRRGRPTEAEAVRILDEAGSARTERLVRSDQRRSGVKNQEQLTPPGARPDVVAGQPTGNGNGDETGPPTRRSVRRGARRTGGIVREQPLEAPINENAPEEGVRTTVRRQRAVTTNTGAPVAVLSGRRRGADGRVAPVRGEPVPALSERGTRHNRDGERRQRAPAASRSQGGIEPSRQLTREETLEASNRLLTMTDAAAEERYLRDLMQLRRRVEETFVPEGQNAPNPAPRLQAPRRIGLSEIPMNVLNNSPVVVRGREVRQGVVTNHRRPRQRPGTRTHEENLRGALGLR